MGQHGGSQHGCGTENDQGPDSLISMTTLDGRGHQGGGPP